jgi:hypothetical protein
MECTRTSGPGSEGEGMVDIVANPGYVIKGRGALNAVLLDGSLGAHNHRKAMELLTSGLQAVSAKKNAP